MRLLSLLVLVFLVAGEVPAQPYPSRPIRMVVPLSAGGFADVPARLLAPRLAAALGRPVFVDTGRWPCPSPAFRTCFPK